MRKRCTAIILAAGQGKRMNSQIQKQFLEIQGKPVLYYSLKCMQESEIIDEIILVASTDMLSYCKEQILEKYQFTKISQIVSGGKERYDSVYAGLLACDPDTDYVFIHDGARPFVTEEILKRALDCVKKNGACVAAVPSKDTVKLSDENQMIASTPERSRVWIIQTPQVFEYAMIRKAHEGIRNKDMSGITDDAMIIEQETNGKVGLVLGSYQNIKITTPEDLLIAEAFLQHKNS